MRLWSLHPSLLDKAGLGAVWREGLLARKVLLGETRGYKNHPQLQRFKQTPTPIAYIDVYLHGIVDEAATRGYKYDRTKLGTLHQHEAIPVKAGQLAYEFAHLQRKLEMRAVPHSSAAVLRPHSLFTATPGGTIESWERVG